jgi:hypothetical protein
MLAAIKSEYLAALSWNSHSMPSAPPKWMSGTGASMT